MLLKPRVLEFALYTVTYRFQLLWKKEMMVFLRSLCTCFKVNHWHLFTLKIFGKLWYVDTSGVLLCNEEEQTIDIKHGWISERCRRISVIWSFRKGKTNPWWQKADQRLPESVKVGGGWPQKERKVKI